MIHEKRDGKNLNLQVHYIQRHVWETSMSIDNKESEDMYFL